MCSIWTERVSLPVDFKQAHLQVEKLKHILNEVWLFLSSRIFLVNFAKLVALSLGLFFLVNFMLRCATHHGESVQVNDFTGMHLQDASRQARDKGFEFVVIDSVWIEGKPSGIIIQQDPKPFSQVKEGRKIYVTVTGSPGKVILPPFSEVSYDFDRYASRLSNLGVKAVVKERVFDAKQAPNTILYLYYDGKKVTEADVKQGFEVMMGSTVEAVVTERTSNQLDIPDLVCKTYEEALFLLTSLNFTLGEVFEDETVTDPSTAYVYRQEPAVQPGVLVTVGTQFNLWLTQEPPAGCPSREQENGFLPGN